MPLTFVRIGESACIKRILGKDELSGSEVWASPLDNRYYNRTIGGQTLLSVKTPGSTRQSMAQRIHV